LIHRGTGNFRVESVEAADLLLVTNGTTALTLDGTSQNATFAGSVELSTAQATLELNNTTRGYQLQAVNSGDYFRILVSGVGDALQIDSARDATFGGNVTLSKAATPTLTLTDTTNSVTNVVYSTDTVGGVGTTSAHNLTIIAGNTTAITIDDTSQDATFSGALLTSASTATRAGFNIAEGVAPTTPVDGDLWITAAGAFNARLNGVTVDVSAGGGGSPWTYTLQTGTSYTAVAGDFVVASNTGTVTITLPSGHSVNDTIIVKKTGATGTVTVDGNASETIDGATTFDLTSQYSSITLISDGTNWLIV